MGSLPACLYEVEEYRVVIQTLILIPVDYHIFFMLNLGIVSVFILRSLKLLL